MNTTPRKYAVAALLAGTLVAGCAPGGDPPSAAAARAALRVIATQPGELGRAEAMAARRCLRARGFDAPLPVAEAGAVQNLPFRVDERAARTVGYGDLVPRGAAASGAAMDAYAGGLPEPRQAGLERALAVHTGAGARLTTPNGWEFTAPRAGCVAEGRAAVYGSVDNWLLAFYLPQDLHLVAADSYLDPRVHAASTRYQDCMAEAGYQTQTPRDAVELARDSAATADRVPAGEVALATADAGCQRRSGVVELWYAEFERRAGPWLNRDPALVIRAAEVVHEATVRAR